MKRYIFILLLFVSFSAKAQQTFTWRMSNDSMFVSSNGGTSWLYVRTGTIFAFGHLFGTQVMRIRNDSLFAEVDGVLTYMPNGMIYVATQLVGSQISGLEGGTTGQYFTKNSNADYDYSWATITAGQVGLGNVNNTSDANKPVSTAQQTALDLKQSVISLTTVGTSGAATFNGSTLNVPNYATGGPTRSFLPTDVINNNAVANTIADVTGLSFPVTANTTYSFKFWIVYSSAATTTGSRWSINGPAATFMNYYSNYTLTATSITNNQGLSSYNTPAGVSASSLTTNNICIIEGIIRPSANGTVIARFASEISSSAITAIASGKSFVEYQIIN